ncbi:hypothetical protein ACFTZI_35735 [Streptomyces decoyicus]|uniref:hypothetical protein n=1 Tax=Streptomyces decoyicus TaxID=249567 RepID=UPI00363B215D
MTFGEADGGTLVNWTTRAEMRAPLVGAFCTRHLVRPMITRSFHSILDAADAALAPHPRAEPGKPAAHAPTSGDGHR